MADDLGWGEVGLYPSKSKHGRIRTPHLDRFGREGMIFRQAYSGYCVCAPSRMAFFTGRHSGRFSSMRVEGTFLRPFQNIRIFPQVLQSAGYVTGLFGKASPLKLPLRQGFNRFVGQLHQGLCHNMYPKYIDEAEGELNFPLSGNVQEKSRELCMANPESYNYTIDVFHTAALAWLEEVSKGPAPFFLYMSYTIPHAGGWADSPLMPETGQPVPVDMGYGSNGSAWPEVERDHAAVISYMDLKVGELMKQLKDLGIDDQTICFFASDNGAHSEGGHAIAFFDSTGGLPGHKGGMYEASVRSPSMVRWPTWIAENQTSELPWAFWDVFPTVAQLAGVKVETPIDGISILPELLRSNDAAKEAVDMETAPPLERYFYFTWRGDGGRFKPIKDPFIKRNGPGYTIRWGNWKGMVPHCWDQDLFKPTRRDRMRLFDLKADPLETTDVAKTKPEIVELLMNLAARKAESHEQLVKAMGIRQTWREAQVIKMDTNVKLQKKENRALINKLKKAFKKVEEHKAEELEKWQIVKEEHEEKIRQVQERRDWALQVFQEELVQDYLDKEQRTQERLAEMREKAREKALKGEEEYLEKLEKSLRQIEAKQKEKEEDFLESLERQAAARVTVGQQHEEIKQEAKKHWTEKVVPKLEKKREEEERLRRKVPRRPKANSSDAMSPKKLKFLQEEAQRRLEQRQSMDELVYRNLQRLQRSHDFKTDQLLSRIEETNARSQEIKDRRQNRHLEREAVMKESLIEKARVHEELRTMKVQVLRSEDRVPVRAYGTSLKAALAALAAVVGPRAKP
ncbi:N-acetylgalactosamine-6-sulfatase (Chondroitinsulfatase) (Chondroitinase) (Galactose-6-sulfate sulfatase) (N-acetylgalactosamine-6-sulfate sulfatase) (GalNAc6S sulfatase) [Durusdinium trenchii]|uniref:N-acetylgalactosamine-6-sulfatase (Chondroitinsulfatase) (Chondroitinase) (Galactose-6-sulfate sulfatase) (N-acetylgalactosamine-6-sulfate sulfatase) (GalNAc6S sulfatase) n=1 Tax=Durusdinium trenchii TaxID=1381693 RepID=A0ABP0LTY7_9DINO